MRFFLLMVVAVSAWTYGPQIPVSVYQHRSAVFKDGSIVISGGRNVTGISGAVFRLTDRNSTWQTLPSIAARISHTMTALANGQILVTGGSGAGGYLNEGLVLDPVTLNWTNVSNTMNVSRAFHRAVLLNTGDVLICGGQGTAGLLRTCDLFSGGRFVPAASMISARDSYTVTVLQNGDALFAGGGTAGAAAELYHPANNSFTPTGSMSTSRTIYAAALLPDGKVLAIGGAGALASCELYDPATGVWNATGSLSVGRSYHQAAVKGNFVYVVGGSSGVDGTSVFEVYNVTSGTWSVDTPLLVPRWVHTLVQFPNGDLFAIGGVGTTISNELATTEVFVTPVPPPSPGPPGSAGSKVWALSPLPLFLLSVISS